MDHSKEVALWVPQLEGALIADPDGGSMVFSQQMRESVSLATLTRFEYEMERISRENPNLEFRIFDDVLHKTLNIKWRHINGSPR